MNEENLIRYYNKFNEDKRLNTRHGKIEFITACKYINEYLDKIKNPKVMDVGAGTGRYSLYLADKGYDVTAVELVKHNLRVIEKKSDKVKSFLGNAIDLSRFKNNSYDLVLLFGPMYHLISVEDKIRALEEAKRIVKDDGIIMISYCMNDYAIIRHGFMDNNIISSIENGKVDDNYHVISSDEDLYSYVRLEDIDKLNSSVGLDRLKIINQAGLSNYLRSYINKLSDEEFDTYVEYHLSICERYEMLGTSSHVLDILKKKDNN